MKRIIIVCGITLLLSLFLFGTAAAQDDDFDYDFSPYDTKDKDTDRHFLGAKISQITLSNTKDVNGGTYISFSTVLTIFDFGFLEADIMSDVAPYSFEDSIVSATQYVKLYSLSDGRGYIGASYLNDLEDSTDNHYAGGSFLPFSSPIDSSAKIGLFGTSVYYSLDEEEYLYRFELFRLTFFF